MVKEGYVGSKQFEGIERDTFIFDAAEYNDCTFKQCDLANTDMKNIRFVECRFESCNLSNVSLASSELHEVSFTNCKLTGTDFSIINPFMFAADFSECVLEYVSFARLPMKKMRFHECNLKHAFFDESNLAEARFLRCDLENAAFNHTNLTKADLSTSYNFIIDPNENTIKKAKFSHDGVIGLLHSFDIIIT